MNNSEMTVIKEESRELNYTKNSRLEDSLFSKDLAPHYMKLAGQLAASEIVPKCYRNKPSDLFLCWAKGYQLGISPEQAMDCISVINGKAVMWGDEMLALCMSHPDFQDIIEEHILDKDAQVIGYTCTIKRKGRTPTVSVFTLQMAKKAGLLAKGGVWNQYPERMLKLRARGFALRDAFPDALKGIKSREEVEDYIEADFKVIDDKNLSRTEILKKDFMNKKGIMNEDNGFTENVATEEDSEESLKSAQPQGMGEVGTEKAEVHSEIKRLIAEKVLTEERVQKALKYYEVDSIESLSVESGIDFINQLVKL